MVCHSRAIPLPLETDGEGRVDGVKSMPFECSLVQAGTVGVEGSMSVVATKRVTLESSEREGS